MLRWRRAFTLVELIATIAILAIVVAISIPFIADYVTQARQTADRQTLEVLNDAINRYKMQGGDVNALTAGKAYGNLLTALKTPVSWQGLTHQFLRSNFAIPSGQTLAGIGSGKNYRLAQYGSYTQEAGGTEVGETPPGPQLVEEVCTATESNSNLSTTFTFSAGVSVGNYIMAGLTFSTTRTIVSVVDSKGNTYALQQNRAAGGGVQFSVYTAVCTSAIAPGDTLTVTFDSTYWFVRCARIFELSNVAAVDAVGNSQGYTLTPSRSLTRTGRALVFGLIAFSFSPTTFTAPNGTEISHALASTTMLVVYKQTDIAATVTVGGTIDSLDNCGTIAIAFR